MTDKSISPIKNRQISNSLTRLNKAASQGRFRIKSLRVKTIQTYQQIKQKQKSPQKQKQKPKILDRNYQLELIHKKFSKQFLKSNYITRSQQSQLKISQIKYYTFLKALHSRIYDTNILNLSTCNFQQKSASMFLNQFILINQDIICYDLSKCTYIPSYQYNPSNININSNNSNSPKNTNQNNTNNKQWIIQKIIKNDKRIIKLIVKNMGFTSIQINKIFNLIIQTQKIFELDISNQNSQSMNRFTQQFDILYQFFKINPTLCIIGLDNLNLRKIGVEQIQKGIALNINNPLKVLSLKNNGINQQASLHISMLARSGLVQLNLSQNPLTPAFFLSLPSWKSSTIRKLNISDTQMNAQSLIFFLSRVQQNKSLQYLKADNNDFSHHWFNQTRQMLQVNTSIQYLSFVDCKINRTCQTFIGLITNRYLKKINLSFNYFSQGVKQLCDMIRLNKVITQIKLRFCGLKSQNFIKIFQALATNDKIVSLDISQNQVGQQGAKQILKTLLVNNTISYLSYQKARIPYRLRQQIQDKIITNRQCKKQKQIITLKKQNIIIKQLDIHTWDEVQQLQAKIRSNNKIIGSLESKVHGLQKQYEQRKHRLHQILKQCKEKQNQLSDNVNALIKKIKELENQEQNYMKKFKIKESNLHQAMDKQTTSIQNLQKIIKQQTQRNQVRESQLQDQYENFKYIQKKKQEKKTVQIKKAGFDTSTALNTKRKSGNH